MVRYIGQRLVGTVIVLFGVSILVFAILYLMPGDAVSVLLFGTRATPEQADKLRHELGLDRPLAVQYFEYLGHVLRGNLGTSYISHRQVTDEILLRFPATVRLTIGGMLVALIVGIPTGILGAIRRGTWVDALASGISVLGVAVPNFWLAVLMALLFSVKLHWFPVLGVGSIRALVLPSIALGWGFAAIITRLVRASMIEILNQPYVTTARAKGLNERVVIIRHALKNAMIPVLTILGLQVANLLSGAVVVESIYARQGIGSLAVKAVQSRDVPLIQGVTLFVAAIYVLVNLLVDVGYALLDPRIHHE